MRGRFDCSLRGYSHIRISKWRVLFLIQRSVQFLALFWAWRTSRFEKRSFIKHRRLTEVCVRWARRRHENERSEGCSKVIFASHYEIGTFMKNHAHVDWRWPLNRVVCLRPPRLLTSRQDTHEIECGWALSEDHLKILSISKTNHMVDGPPEIIMRIAISNMIYFRLFYN